MNESSDLLLAFSICSKSSIPYMQRLLNLENNKLKNFESSVYDCPSELYLFDEDAITVDNLN